MSSVFIFHGIEGHPGENWLPWMKKELEANGHRAIVPKFTDPDEPLLDVWLEDFKKYEESVDGDSIFVGHSLGAAFALRALAHFRKPVRTCFLVAPVWEVMGNPFDPRMSTFEEPPHDWAVIRTLAKKFFVIHGENDPYITRAKSDALALHLQAPLTVIANGGHLNAAAGFLEFPQLRDMILQELKA